MHLRESYQVLSAIQAERKTNAGSAGEQSLPGCVFEPQRSTMVALSERSFNPPEEFLFCVTIVACESSLDLWRRILQECFGQAGPRLSHLAEQLITTLQTQRLVI